jgi:hypothetical protein
LLHAYVERHDEEAFRGLVERYVHVVHSAARRQVADAPYPLILTELGKGRIVSCSIANNSDTPAELLSATGGQFMRRAVRWAANQPVE